MQASGHLRFLVGTYTDSPSQSKGIGQVSLNQKTGEIIRLDDFYPIRNPSYLIQSSRAVYSFSEVSQQQGAQLVCLKGSHAHAIPIEGDYPCHLATSSDEQYLAIANYGSGNVSIYSLDSRGIPITSIVELFEEGQGPNQDRQQSPHAHQVLFQNTESTLVSVDLGSDAVRFYRVEDDTFTLTQALSLPAGSGPRHLVFNRAEDVAYVVCELSETLVVLNQTQQGWQVGQQIDLLPNHDKGEAASAIKLSDDERFVYVSCRQQNAISCFDVTEETVRWVSMVDVDGLFPRDFIISSCGEWLIAANQHSNNLVSYHRNPQDGSLRATGYQCQIDAPVCLLELNNE